MLQFRLPTPQVERYHFLGMLIAFTSVVENQDPIISIKSARDLLGILAIATPRDFGILTNFLSIKSMSGLDSDLLNFPKTTSSMNLVPQK